MKNYFIVLILLTSIKISFSQEVIKESNGIKSIKGTAFNDKRGALVKDKIGRRYYVKDKLFWSENELGKRIKVKGELYKYHIKNYDKIRRYSQSMRSWKEVSASKIKVKSFWVTRDYKKELEKSNSGRGWDEADDVK